MTSSCSWRRASHTSGQPSSVLDFRPQDNRLLADDSRRDVALSNLALLQLRGCINQYVKYPIYKVTTVLFDRKAAWERGTAVTRLLPRVSAQRPCAWRTLELARGVRLGQTVEATSKIGRGFPAAGHLPEPQERRLDSRRAGLCSTSYTSYIPGCGPPVARCVLQDAAIGYIPLQVPPACFHCHPILNAWIVPRQMDPVIKLELFHFPVLYC